MSHRTTIAFVDHTPFAGGAQLVLAEHIRCLDKKKYHPIVVCTDTVPLLIERYQSAGAQVVLLNMPRLKGSKLKAPFVLIRAGLQLRRILRQMSVDMVISNTARASYLSYIAVIGRPTPLIWWVRDYLYQQAIFNLLLHRVSMVICVSQSIKNHYLAPDNHKGQVIYVASNLYQQLEQVKPSQVQQQRAQWGISQSDIVIGFMGRLVKEKGADVLIHAVVQLHQQYPQLKALICGTGQGQEHNIEQQLKTYIADHKLQDFIILAGYQTDEAAYYSSFDIFSLNTIDAEPFATTVVQAMMAKNAVIATDAGGTNELVVTGQTGILVQPADVSSLASAISSLIDDDKLRHKLAQQGYQQVMAEHREETVTATVQALYQQVLSREKL